MVSFHCDACQDVVKKPKLDSHHYRCHASFTCVDCSTTFSGPNHWKGHTSCISEAEKYQKGLYKGPKKADAHNKSQGRSDGTIQNAAPKAHNGRTEDSSPLEEGTERSSPRNRPSVNADATQITIPSTGAQEREKASKKRKKGEAKVPPSEQASEKSKPDDNKEKPQKKKKRVEAVEDAASDIMKSEKSNYGDRADVTQESSNTQVVKKRKSKIQPEDAAQQNTLLINTSLSNSGAEKAPKEKKESKKHKRKEDSIDTSLVSESSRSMQADAVSSVRGDCLEMEVPEECATQEQPSAKTHAKKKDGKEKRRKEKKMECGLSDEDIRRKEKGSQFKASDPTVSTEEPSPSTKITADSGGKKHRKDKNKPTDGADKTDVSSIDQKSGTAPMEADIEKEGRSSKDRKKQSKKDRPEATAPLRVTEDGGVDTTAGHEKALHGEGVKTHKAAIISVSSTPTMMGLVESESVAGKKRKRRKDEKGGKEKSKKSENGKKRKVIEPI